MLITQHQDHPIPGDYIGCIQKGFPPEPGQYAGDPLPYSLALDPLTLRTTDTPDSISIAH